MRPALRALMILLLAAATTVAVAWAGALRRIDLLDAAKLLIWTEDLAAREDRGLQTSSPDAVAAAFRPRTWRCTDYPISLNIHGWPAAALGTVWRTPEDARRRLPRWSVSWWDGVV